MTTRPLMLALAISATLLAGCKQQAASSPPAGVFALTNTYVEPAGNTPT